MRSLGRVFRNVSPRYVTCRSDLDAPPRVSVTSVFMKNTAFEVQFESVGRSFAAPRSSRTSRAANTSTDPREVLSDLTITVAPGELVAILGTCGGGKSTRDYRTARDSWREHPGSGSNACGRSARPARPAVGHADARRGRGNAGQEARGQRASTTERGNRRRGSASTRRCGRARPAARRRGKDADARTDSSSAAGSRPRVAESGGTSPITDRSSQRATPDCRHT